MLLWHYQVPGTLTRGNDYLLRGGSAVQVVNGAIYFLVDTGPQLVTPDKPTYQLMALRASDGKLLWKQQIPYESAELIGISDEVACIAMTPNASILREPLTFQCYRADTGALAWRRQGSDIDPHIIPGIFSGLGGLLYFIAAVPGASGNPDHTRFIAVQMHDGKTRWSYDDQQADTFFRGFPLLSEQGIVVFFLATGDLFTPNSNHEALVGLDESSGKQLWRYQVPGFLTNKFSHQQLPFPASFGVESADGVLYFVSLTTQPGTFTVTSLSVIALRIADGRQLWQTTLTQGGAVLLDTLLVNGMFYLAFDHSDGTPRGVWYDTTIAAVQASSGQLRWQNHFNRLLTYTTLTASPNGAAVLAHDGTVAELDAGNGSNRWQSTVTVPEDEVFLSLMQAGGKLVEAYQGFHTTTPASIGTAHICALEPANGQKLWCHDFPTQVWVVELGP